MMHHHHHHQCSGSQSQGPCSCGMFHGGSFSMFFSVPPNHKHYLSSPSPSPSGDQLASDMYSNNYASSSPSSVDCTLSLGTPSTRLTEPDDHGVVRHHERRSAGSYVSSFCWDLLHPKRSSQKSNNDRVGGGGDPLLARRCANCDTTSTPLWRNGPRGPKSLCNACGIRFKKEERRASTAAATVNTTAVGGGNYTNSSWIPHHSQTQKIPCLSQAAINNEFRFMEEDNHRTEPENGISFLSWRLNVTDRPSLVHDFTR